MIVRTSRWAVWARRLGSFALPLIVLSVWMHREYMLDSDAFQIVLGIAALLSVLAILTGIGAYVRLWQTGDHGWGRASMGIFLGLVCLVPFAYGGYLATQYPFTNDVSTDHARPLQLFSKTEARRSRSAASPEDVLAAFPGVTPRTYPLEPARVFELAEELIEARRWEIRVRRAPVFDGREGHINMLAMTFMGWRDEVVIRVGQSGQGTRVDMRSVSLSGEHDLGVNGKRIESFLADLDEKVNDALRSSAPAHTDG